MIDARLAHRAGATATAQRASLRNARNTSHRHAEDFLAQAGQSVYNPSTMANLYYKDRLIIAYASLNQSDKRWSAGAEITWRRDGNRQSHSIGGLADRFSTAEEAEQFVVNLAKTWIDGNP